MPALLAVDASPRYENSVSRRLTMRFVDHWKAAHPAGRVIRRDLMKTRLPFIDLSWIGGAFMPPERQSAEMKEAIRGSDELVAELMAADHIVIGTPMYNFSIPTRLKAYIDHVVRVGVTVTANKGLLTGKSADIILASGGNYSPGSPVEKYNLASGYLRQVLAWIGITDVNIVPAPRAVAGAYGETAVERLAGAVEAAVERKLSAPALVTA